jgi:hypothetical protein
MNARPLIASLRFSLIGIIACFGSARLHAAPELEYNHDIRPILSDRCFKCHGPDKGSRKAGLRLDLPEEAYAERKKSHLHAIVPGKPDESLVCNKIFATSPDDLMPPPESNLALSAKEKETIRRWIAEGALYQPHWAFIPPPAIVPVPHVKNRKWSRNEIDQFILARLEKEKISPSPEAPRARWLRRVTLDLTGLPPRPVEIDEFLADKSAGACEKVVDRLFASPHFGERMAVPWLDAARYADSYGYQSDQLCPTWPYRDWVVDAFNRNLPYDQFLTEQLAGDLLPGPTRETRLATAFSRLHRQTNEGGSIEEEWRNEYVSDRVHTFSTAMLGLTFECARCHDHKFDPITQRDYYGLGAFFNSIDEYGTYNGSAHVPTPSLLLPTPSQDKAMQETEAALKLAAENLAVAIKTGSGAPFKDWLKLTKVTPEIPGLIGSFNFDDPEGTNRFANAVNPTNPSGGLGANVRTNGHEGMAIRFTGDDELSIPNLLGSLEPWKSYTVLFWLKVPAGLTNAVIFHRCAGTDTGFHGTELSIEEGRLFFVIKRFWPGNALAIRSNASLPTDEWVQVGVSYDGSARASGMRLFVNGEVVDREIVRDHLYKSPENGGGGLSFGALFRSAGLKDGMLDELRIYDRALAPIEVRQTYDGHALADAIAAGNEDQLRDWYLAAFSKSAASGKAALSKAVEQYYAARNPVTETSVMEEMNWPRPAYVLARGRYDAPKTEDKRAPRSTPAILPQFPANAPTNRLGLAEWLVAPGNPLTARVAVNRFWQIFFGRGIVATPENFGTQGSDPTHPELLDWLARDFVSSGWDVKRLVKKIVLSATYRQDSKMRSDLKVRDPENLLLARGPSRRLTAEMIRDTALAASGLLDERMGGPPVSPYQPGDLWRESNTMSPAYHQSTGTDLYRRSLYTVWKRTAPMANMSAFDAPSREVCVIRRAATATPQQSFVLLNDPQFVEAARVLAEETLDKPGANPAARISFAFRRLAGREPDARERALLEALFKEQQEIFSKEPARAEKLINTGQHPHNAAADPVTLAAATVMVQTIMNLDATVWNR